MVDSFDGYSGKGKFKTLFGIAKELKRISSWPLMDDSEGTDNWEVRNVSVAPSIWEIRETKPVPTEPERPIPFKLGSEVSKAYYKAMDDFQQRVEEYVVSRNEYDGGQQNRYDKRREESDSDFENDSDF